MSEEHQNAWHQVGGVTDSELEQAAREAQRLYGDIIDLPRPVSREHPPLSMDQKAAQYSPFAALTGYDTMIDEAGRLTDEKPVLSEDRKSELDAVLSILRERIADEPEASVTWFEPDHSKDGGKSVTMTGHVRMIDQLKRRIVFSDGQEIEIEDILDLTVLQ